MVLGGWKIIDRLTVFDLTNKAFILGVSCIYALLVHGFVHMMHIFVHGLSPLGLVFLSESSRY